MNTLVEALSSEEAYLLLHSVGGTLDAELTARLAEVRGQWGHSGQQPDFVFQLNDGTVLDVSHGTRDFNPRHKWDWARESQKISLVTLFVSREDFVDRTDWSKPTLPPPDPVASVQIYGADFPEHVSELSAQLAERLNLAPDALDGTLWTLDVVDEALVRIGPDAVAPEVFASLIAYVGEIIRVAVQGEWKMERKQESYPYGDESDEEIQTFWKPYIIGRDGSEDEDICSQLSTAFLEDSDYFTAAIVRSRIWHTLSREERTRSNALIDYIEDPEDGADDPTRWERYNTVAALKDMGVDVAPSLNFLIEALADRDSSVRGAAADALGNLGISGEPAVLPLMKALNDPKDMVRINAASALGDLYAVAASAIPALEAARDSASPQMRQWFAEPLARIQFHLLP